MTRNFIYGVNEIEIKITSEKEEDEFYFDMAFEDLLKGLDVFTGHQGTADERSVATEAASE